MKYLHPIPNFVELLNKYSHRLLSLAQQAREETNRTDAYRSWEEIRYHFGPDGISSEEWWLGIKFNRLQARQTIPLNSTRGKAFSYIFNNLVMKQLRYIDSMAGGTLSSDSPTTLTVQNKNKYLISSLEEESIMSSILEGASVTRTDAKSMLRENRIPNSTDEQMIANNYKTMQHIISWKTEKLTPERLLSIHKMMSEGTLDLPEREGCWRCEADHVRIEEDFSGEIVHTPPSATEIPQLMQSLCDFANSDDETHYIHPVLKAIILHFWLAYVHPFVDGNGRTARALFYWVMLKHGYWLFEYITISNEIRKKKHGRSYYDAFRHTEMDDEDLNYFISDQLRTISDAIDSFYSYIQRKKQEQDNALIHVQGHISLNVRQRMLLSSMLKDSTIIMTVEFYASSNRVVRETARTDLHDLVKKGYLTSRRVGRIYYFTPVPNLEDCLKM